MSSITHHGPVAVVLGTAQDGGYPQPGCTGPCCEPVRVARLGARLPACMGLTDPLAGKRFIIDATWAMNRQLCALDKVAPGGLDGILLTHAHMGHYTGLVYLGREAMACRDLPVYAMERMARFIQNNDPWSALVAQGHIRLEVLTASRQVALTPDIRIEAVTVPHRDEFSETVAYIVQGPRHSVLHLPDIDGWDGWLPGLESLLERVDAAWIDGTFYSDQELPGRDLTSIPHPRISQTLARLARLPSGVRAKVRLTHLNHTNPVLDLDSSEAKSVMTAGVQIAYPGETYAL